MLQLLSFQTILYYELQVQLRKGKQEKKWINLKGKQRHGSTLFNNYACYSNLKTYHYNQESKTLPAHRHGASNIFI